MLDQSLKHVEFTNVGNQEAATADGLVYFKVQAAKVIASLKYVVFEDPSAPKEVILEVVDNSEALNAGGTGINMNLLLEYVFY